MESTGLALGAAGLAGMFTACVNCFEYVQLGCHFGKDYGKCLLKLDLAKVRMSRWGAAMGLVSDLQQQIQISDHDCRLTHRLLEQIKDSFEDAESLSDSFKKRTARRGTQSDDLATYDAQSDLDPEYQRLHLTMRELAIKRQRGTSIVKKTSWALYERKKFDTLIGEVTGLIDQLVDLFPSIKDNQRTLCTSEVSAVGETRDLALVQDIASSDDKLLEESLNNEMESRGHIITNWKADGNSTMWAGDDNAFGVTSKSHEISEFSVSDHANVRLGNVNRGRINE
jgi:Prion-inhibition and propagation